MTHNASNTPISSRTSLGNGISRRCSPRPCLFFIAALFLGPTVALIAGCGPDTGSRVLVAGTVSLAGSPLPAGTIEFHPLGEGSPTGGMIRDGQFQIPAIKGPVAGEYTVKIFATDASGEPVIAPDAPPGDSSMPLPPELIPERYNTQSELVATIGPRGTTDLAFALEP